MRTGYFHGFAFALLAVTALVPATGCAPLKTTVFADEQIRPTLKSLPNRLDYPLARTLTWKYHFSVDTPGSRMAWFFADGQTIAGQQAMKGVQLYAAQPATSGMDMGEVYTRRAQEATKRGDHQSAQINYGLASTATQTRIANERIATGLALGGAIAGLGDALLLNLHFEVGNSAARYVREVSPRIIGDQAPEGTVLEVFFRGNRLDHADIKPTVTAVRWETIATLKDAQGKIWRSNAFYTVYYAHSPASEPGPPQMPERFRDANPVLMDVGNWVPAGGKDEYMPSIVEIAKMPLSPPGTVELSVTAASAVAGLYEEIELAKGPKGRRPR
jgi:hypothetical protein